MHSAAPQEQALDEDGGVGVHDRIPCMQMCQHGGENV